MHHPILSILDRSSTGLHLAAVGQGAKRAATGSMDILAAYLRVPGRAAAAGDRTLPVPAGVASGVLVFLGVVEVPDPAEAVIVETGARHRLQISDENLGGAAQTSMRWTKWTSLPHPLISMSEN
ncbi:hypothetical protein BDA96_06G078200 [Sorghum bicolor]|uniref:Uncharacterized protein n=2 Tax=Sorghum bicolor TaxID=4558 RepID=A0A921UBQ4_SORBI|nr:hypothetical protein BDA96_06G078200 [Sorghum bicolor]OQU81518.1 hypothetical protein SORBI_3006G069766 [Sorghum bicolor]